MTEVMLIAIFVLVTLLAIGNPLLDRWPNLLGAVRLLVWACSITIAGGWVYGLITVVLM